MQEALLFLLCSLFWVRFGQLGISLKNEDFLCFVLFPNLELNTWNHTKDCRSYKSTNSFCLFTCSFLVVLSSAVARLLKPSDNLARPWNILKTTTTTYNSTEDAIYKSIISHSLPIEHGTWACKNCLIREFCNLELILKGTALLS